MEHRLIPAMSDVPDPFAMSWKRRVNHERCFRSKAERDNGATAKLSGMRFRGRIVVQADDVHGVAWRSPHDGVNDIMKTSSELSPRSQAAWRTSTGTAHMAFTHADLGSTTRFAKGYGMPTSILVNVGRTMMLNHPPSR